jgi:hypothetical protein
MAFFFLFEVVDLKGRFGKHEAILECVFEFFQPLEQAFCFVLDFGFGKSHRKRNSKQSVPKKDNEEQVSK